MKFINSLPEYSGEFERLAEKEGRRPEFLGPWWWCQVYRKWFAERCGCPQPPYQHECGGVWE